jgi:hypothetical protein
VPGIIDTAGSGMEANVKNGVFRIRKVRLEQHGFAYDTFELTGYLAGERIRNRFKTRELAVGEKTRLEVKVANGAGDVRAVVTRLSELQVRAAETLFALTPDPLAAVQCYFANFGFLRNTRRTSRSSAKKRPLTCSAASSLP